MSTTLKNQNKAKRDTQTQRATKESGFQMVQKRNQRIASSRKRTNNLLAKAVDLGLIDTYVDYKGRVRTKKEK